MITIKYKSVLLGLLSLLSVSCQEDAIWDDVVNYKPNDGLPRVDVNVKVKSEIAGNPKGDYPESRTEFDNPTSKRLRWIEGDEIGVFSLAKRSETSDMIGAEAANVTKFKALLNSGSNQYFGTFDGTATVTPISDYCIFYPYQESAAWVGGKISKHDSPRERVQSIFSDSKHVGKYAFAATTQLNVNVKGENLDINSGKLNHQVVYYAIALDSLINSEPGIRSYGGNKVDSVMFRVIASDIAKAKPKLWGPCELDWYNVGEQNALRTDPADKRDYSSIVVKCGNMTLPDARPSSVGRLNIFFTSYPVSEVKNYQIVVYMTRPDGAKEKFTFTKPNGNYSFKPGVKYSMKMTNRDDEDVLDFVGMHAAAANIYYGNIDAHNDYLGDGFVDDFNSSAPKNMNFNCFEFIPITDVKITAPESGTDLKYSSETSITEWADKTSNEIPIGQKEVIVKKGSLCLISLNIAKGEFSHVWTVERLDNGKKTMLTLNRKQSESFLGKTKFLKVHRLDQFNDYNTTPLLVKKEYPDGLYFDLTATNVIKNNASAYTSAKDLGYRSAAFVQYNENNQHEYHYVSQVGLGISAAAIKIAKLTTTDDWTYYIPANNSEDDIIVKEWGGDLLFMIGKTEGLEIPLSAPIGTSWNNTPGRTSWSTFPVAGAVGPNKHGFYKKVDKYYTEFAYNGVDSPCEHVFPKGAWRAPTKAEVESFRDPNTGSPYPHLQKYGYVRIVVGGIHADLYMPYYSNSNGVLASNREASARGLQLGPYYYISANPGYHQPDKPSTEYWYSGYPVTYVPGFATKNTAPVANVEVGFTWRDACGVVCIRQN